MRPTKAMNDAFKEGFEHPNAPLTPGEQRLIYHQVGPRIVFGDDLPAEPVVIDVGEITHSPCPDDGEITDAEIIE